MWAFISRDIDGELFSRLPGRMGIEVPEARHVSLKRNVLLDFLVPPFAGSTKKRSTCYVGRCAEFANPSDLYGILLIGSSVRRCGD